MFRDDVPWDVRRQILMAQAASTMSDIERARFFGFPEGCRIREGAKVLSPEKLNIGKYCWIGENAILDASGGLSIGDHTSVGLGVFLWTHDSHTLNIKGQNSRDNSEKIKRKPTKIGSNCFIAGPSVIMPGVTIGNKCIISPMSVVYDDIPDNTIYRPYKEFLDSNKEVGEMRDKILYLEEKLLRLEKIVGK